MGAFPSGCRAEPPAGRARSRRQHANARSPRSQTSTPRKSLQICRARWLWNADIATAIKSQHDMQVQSINAQRSFDAKKAYDDASAVATAPAGAALQVLTRLRPDEAKVYDQNGATDDQIRAHARAIAGIVHDESRMPVDQRDDGVMIDATTKKPVVVRLTTAWAASMGWWTYRLQRCSIVCGNLAMADFSD